MQYNAAATAAVRSLSHGERVGVRGYGLSCVPNPSPGATRRPLPKGEVYGTISFRTDYFSPTERITEILQKSIRQGRARGEEAQGRDIEERRLRQEGHRPQAGDRDLPGSARIDLILRSAKRVSKDGPQVAWFETPAFAGSSPRGSSDLPDRKITARRTHPTTSS